MARILPTLYALVLLQFYFPAFSVRSYSDCVLGSECCQNVGDLQLSVVSEKILIQVPRLNC